MSCSGAETRDLEKPQRTVENGSVPPQLRAVDGRTDLVTLGIGGNDFNLFATLVATCSRTGQQDATGSLCADRLEQRGVDLVALADRIETRVERAIRQVRRRAPEATVVVVGYPRLTPTSGSCRALPFAPGDYQYGARVSEALNDALEQAARHTDATFVDMHTASNGHDVCSSEPSVNGYRTVQGEDLAYHRFAAGMEAVADRVIEVLAGGGTLPLDVRRSSLVLRTHTRPCGPLSSVNRQEHLLVRVQTRRISLSRLVPRDVS